MLNEDTEIWGNCMPSRENEPEAEMPFSKSRLLGFLQQRAHPLLAGWANAILHRQQKWKDRQKTEVSLKVCNRSPDNDQVKERPDLGQKKTGCQ